MRSRAADKDKPYKHSLSDKLSAGSRLALHLSLIDQTCIIVDNVLHLIFNGHGDME